MITTVEHLIIVRGKRLLNLPSFNAIKVSFLGLEVQTVYDGYFALKPIYINWLVDLNAVPVAYGETIRIDKNPQLAMMPAIPQGLTAIGIDVSGKYSIELSLLNIA